MARRCRVQEIKQAKRHLRNWCLMSFFIPHKRTPFIVTSTTTHDRDSDQRFIYKIYIHEWYSNAKSSNQKGHTKQQYYKG